MKCTRKPTGSVCSGLFSSRPNRCAPKQTYSRLSAILSWKHVILCVLAMAVSVEPFYAQRGGGAHGSGGRGNAGIGYPGRYPYPAASPSWQPIPDIPPLPKPVITDDEKCFPWILSEARATTVSVTRLKVPSKARRDFQKGCEAANKHKLDEAEQHARKAIDKFQNYSAAWVLLGVILEQKSETERAGDACSRAVAIDPKYLPAYLCKAEFAVRTREWNEVLDMADMAQGLNSQGDSYAFYYRATAQLHLNDIGEAKKSALQAEALDVKHSEPFIYLLLAQIYEHEGDTANAISQLQELLKHNSGKQQEDQAKKYLAELESQQSSSK
jgi:Tetratricopeptide repeat